MTELKYDTKKVTRQQGNRQLQQTRFPDRELEKEVTKAITVK